MNDLQKQAYDKAPKRVQEIVDIVESQSDNEAACYSGNGHSIFDDWNLGKQSIYNSMINDEYWVEYIIDMQKRGNTQENFIKGLKGVLSAIEAMSKLTSYSDDELEQAEYVFWGDD